MVQALPAISLGQPYQGMIQSMSPDELARQEAARDKAKADLTQPGNDDLVQSQLAGYIRTQFDVMRRHRSTTAGWNDRLLKAQRAFKGEYDPSQLAEIQKFGGSTIYSRVIAGKCRGATALLREVYLGPERAWGVDPTPEPVLPDNVADAVQRLVSHEVQGTMKSGQPTDLTAIKDRINTLMDAALAAAKKKAREEAVKAEDHLDKLLIEGNFYKALAEILTDIPLFCIAIMKGPVVRIVPTVRWENGQAVEELRPRMFWARVSPFDFYYSPGVSDIADADTCEKSRVTRKDLNDLMGLPGYDEDAIRQVITDYGTGGLHDWLDPTDSERALRENKENPVLNQSNMIDCLEFNGCVQGELLLQYGVKDQIEDPIRDYAVQAWLIGRHVIKVQLNPNPRKRHPYYVTSFEKAPGTVIGNALPDILEDIQQVANSTLRAIVNNESIASGPQVVVNLDRLAPGEDGQQMYPWKRWFVTSDPIQNSTTQKPVEFFQPNSNIQELMGLYEKLTQIADELSAIPRYMSGSDRMGGAGRTASGLAMLMGNASKLLQTVAANIDRDIMEPLLQGLYEMVMLTDDSGVLRGDESIRVRGVDVAVQRETNRQRQLEFLQITSNPIDSQIMGVKGRAEVLRTVSHTIGIDGDAVVPTEDEINAQQKAQQATQQATQALPPPGVTSPGNGNQAPAPGDHPLGVDQANQSRAMSPTPGRIPIQ